MITIPMFPNYSKNAIRGRYAEGLPCVVCGKPCPDPRWMIHVWEGTDAVTDEEAKTLDPAGDLGMYPIGSDCLRKHPELKPYAIPQRLAETEFVTNQQYDGYARRIERANLKAHGRSLSVAGIARRANSYIVDIQNDRNGMIVHKGWREAMQTELMPAQVN